MPSGNSSMSRVAVALNLMPNAKSCAATWSAYILSDLYASTAKQHQLCERRCTWRSLTPPVQLSTTLFSSKEGTISATASCQSAFRRHVHRGERACQSLVVCERPPHNFCRGSHFHRGPHFPHATCELSDVDGHVSGRWFGKRNTFLLLAQLTGQLRGVVAQPRRCFEVSACLRQVCSAKTLRHGLQSCLLLLPPGTRQPKP